MAASSAVGGGTGAATAADRGGIGVGLRYLHRALDDTEMTDARHLRERRLDQVVSALRAAERRPALHLVASRYGFGGQEQLARAFRRRSGTSMSDSRESAPR